MAFDKYKNSAWQEPEVGAKRYEASAWTMCESAKLYKSSAWEEIWADVKYMSLIGNGISTGELNIPADGSIFNYYKMMDAAQGYGTIGGGGTITFALEGEWTNPTISFDWNGDFTYKTSTSSTMWYQSSAGYIRLYHRTKGSSSYNVTKVVDPVGETASGTANLPSGAGSYSGTLTGTFSGLGLQIYVSGYNGSFYNAFLSLVVSNLKFDGRKIGFPVSANFNNQQWPT